MEMGQSGTGEEWVEHGVWLAWRRLHKCGGVSADRPGRKEGVGERWRKSVWLGTNRKSPGIDRRHHHPLSLSNGKVGVAS